MARLYVVGGGKVQALNAVTLTPLSAGGGGLASRLRGLPIASQLVQSPDGTKLAIIRGNAETAAKRSTLTVVSVADNTVVRKDVVTGLTLLGVSNDGHGWYGFSTTRGGRLVRFVSARAGLRHTLDFHLAQPCCVLFQYDRARDRLYALTLRTVWNAGVPESAAITTWQLSSRQRIANLAITGLVAGTRIDHSAVPVDRVIPSFTLSPDGRTLAILDFVDRRLDTIDALRLRWTRNPFVSGWGSSPDITLGPTTMPSSRLSGVEGLDIAAHFSLDGRTLYVEGTENNDHKTAVIFPESEPTRAIDVVHSTLRGVVSMTLVAPLKVGTDGSSVYTAVVKRAGPGVSVLVQRRRASNLSLIAEHSITPFAASYQIVGVP
ncbi:MAG: hypothetical protein ACRDFX_03350 [Chloroflexota bacterium]